jgi:hypothetical protein
MRTSENSVKAKFAEFSTYRRSSRNSSSTHLGDKEFTVLPIAYDIAHV